MLESFKGLSPNVDPSAFVHDDAILIGDVTIGARASIWPGVVLRGDQGAIHIGEETNIQDGTIIHSTGGVSTTTIGPRVTVGHRVLLHGCHVEQDCLIGMGAILLDLCVIETKSIVGAGALVPVGKRIETGSMVMGVPGRVVRQISDEEFVMFIEHGREEYLRLAAEYGGWE